MYKLGKSFSETGIPKHTHISSFETIDTVELRTHLEKPEPLFMYCFVYNVPSRQVYNQRRQLIETAKKITCQQIRALLGIGMSQVQNILHVHLKVRKLCTRWIPHDLTEDQKRLRVQWCRKMIKKFNGGQSLAVYNIVTGDETWVYCFEPERKSQSAEWVFPFEDLPTKVKKSRSTGKIMVASFFGKSGHYSTVSLEDQRTVTADWYIKTCLPRVLEKVREKRPRSNVLLHHDNASSHSAKVTEAYLKASN